MNIILILSAAKKVNELTLCSGLKGYILMVSKLAFAFRFIGPIIFSQFKKVNFPYLMKFSLIKELFRSQENYPS